MGPTNHVTLDATTLTNSKDYTRPDTFRVSNGAGLNISSIPHTLISLFARSLHLRNVLHVLD